MTIGEGVQGSWVYRPPAEVTTEIVIDPFRSVFALFDDEGRPLGEGNAPEEKLRGVELQWFTCKYAGSRHGRPMNVSGLRQMTSQWNELLSLIAWLRVKYLERSQATELDLGGTWKLSMFVCMLPYYLHYRRDAPVGDRELPALLASAYKLLAGIFQAVEHKIAFGMAMGLDLHAPITPEELITYADDNSVFEGKDGVCSGPPHLISQAVTLVVRGTGGPEPSDRGFAPLIGDIDRASSFVDAALRMELAKRVFQIESVLLEADLHRRVCAVDPPSELAERVRAHYQGLTRPFQVLLHSDFGSELGRALSSRLSSELAALGSPLEFRVVEPQGERAEADPTTRALLAALDRYTLLEQSALRAFTTVQREIDMALGRTSNAELTRGHLTDAFGGTPRDRIEAWLAA